MTPRLTLLPWPGYAPPHASRRDERASFEALYEPSRALPEHLTGEILVPGALRTISRSGKAYHRAAFQWKVHAGTW